MSSVKLSWQEIQLYMDCTLYIYIHIWTPEFKYECVLTAYSQYTYIQGAARILSYLDNWSLDMNVSWLYAVSIRTRCSQDTFTFGLAVQVWTYICTKYSSHTVVFHTVVFISFLFSYNLVNLIRRTLTTFTWRLL